MAERLRIDFRTHSRTLSGDRGAYFETSNRALVILANHESLEDILATLQHESIHCCLKDDDEIDEEQEEEIIFRMAWAECSII